MIVSRKFSARGFFKEAAESRATCYQVRVFLRLQFERNNRDGDLTVPPVAFQVHWRAQPLPHHGATLGMGPETPAPRWAWKRNARRYLDGVQGKLFFERPKNDFRKNRRLTLFCPFDPRNASISPTSGNSTAPQTATSSLSKTTDPTPPRKPSVLAGSSARFTISLWVRTGLSSGMWRRSCRIGILRRGIVCRRVGGSRGSTCEFCLRRFRHRASDLTFAFFGTQQRTYRPRRKIKARRLQLVGLLQQQRRDRQEGAQGLL